MLTDATCTFICMEYSSYFAQTKVAGHTELQKTFTMYSTIQFVTLLIGLLPRAYACIFVPFLYFWLGVRRS